MISMKHLALSACTAAGLLVALPAAAQFAKPEIWREMDKVKAGADKLVADTAALSAAAKTGNLDQIRAAFGTVGQTCKACHDNYRAERYSN